MSSSVELDKDKFVIGIFATNQIRTGAHRRYIELLLGLAKRNYKVICYSPVDFFNNRIYKHIPLQINQKSPIPISVQLLFKVLLDRKNNCLKNNSKILVFSGTTNLAAIVLSRKLNAPIVLGVRSNLYEDRKLSISNHGIKVFKYSFENKYVKKAYLWLFSKYEKIVYQKADIITVQNPDDKKNIKMRTKNDKIYTIPNNINVNWIEKHNFESSNTSISLKKICFIGSLIERKGIRHLLKAYNTLSHEQKDIELHIAGKGRLDKYIREFVKKKRLDRVFLYGHIENPLTFLKSMDLLVVPSTIDSFPNVIFESWYVGTPVIGSKVGGIYYQLLDERLLFKPGNPEDIYKKLKRSLNPEYYEKIREISNERKKQFVFDWIEEYEKILNYI